jgi:hypothetical protein
MQLRHAIHDDAEHEREHDGGEREHKVEAR